MRKFAQMIVVLTCIALGSGLVLGGLNTLTEERVENNILRFKKIPAVTSIYQGITEEELGPEEMAALEEQLLQQRKQVQLDDGTPVTLFPLEKNDKLYAVALEKSGQGFEGEVGVMVGFKLDTGDLVGIGITTHSETPGVGSRITEEAFRLQFRGMSKDAVMKVKKDGGDIDAVTGATFSSRGVAEALRAAVKLYEQNHKEIERAMK